MDNIHEKIKNERIKARLSEEEMARRLKVSRSTYQYWEMKTPKIDKVKRISVALGLPADYFFGNNDENTSTTKPPADPRQTILTGANVTLQDYIDDLRRDKETLYALANSILDQIKLDTKTALAYQMAWVEYEAERAAKGDEETKLELIHKMNTLVRSYLPNHTSAHSETESGKRSKA